MASFLQKVLSWFKPSPQSAVPLLVGRVNLIAGFAEVKALLADPAGNLAGGAEIMDQLQENTIKCLAGKPGLEVQRIHQTLKLPEGATLFDRVLSAEKEARKWLVENQADVLIWGEFLEDGSGVRWRVCAREERYPGLGAFRLEDTLCLPPEPDEICGQLFHSVILTAMAPQLASQRLRVRERQLEALDNALIINNVPPRGLPKPIYGSMLNALGIVTSDVAARSEGKEWLAQADLVFQNCWKFLDQKASPIYWASAKRHHARLLATYSNVMAAQGQAIWERCQAAYSDVATVFTKSDFPMEWAACQVELGKISERRARISGDAENFKEAAQCYKNALEVYGVREHPLYWADCMASTGRALMHHGEHVKGTASLEQAGVAFQGALKVYEREHYPAQWASVQNNLGATLFSLAKRKPGTPEWLEHCFICLQNARDYYQEVGNVRGVHLIEKNIAKAQTLKDTREEIIRNDLLN